MATTPPRPLSRDALAKFLPDAESIRKFEKLFQSVDQAIPDDIDLIFSRLDENQTDAGSAQATANQAVAQLMRMADALEKLATEPRSESANTIGLDAANFNVNRRRVQQVGQLSWNALDDTLDLVHTGGVTQQIGSEIYIRGRNVTGSTLLNGSCVYFAGTTSTDVVDIDLFIADGSINPFVVLGILTQDVLAGDVGYVTVFGKVREIDTTGTPYGETWADGDTLYASPNTAGWLTNIKPTAPDQSIPMGFVIFADATDGILFSRPLPEQQKYYGEFIKTDDQSPASANTAYPIELTATMIANGVSLTGTPTTEITVANAGLYNVQANTQITSGNASTKIVWLWFRINGVDVPNSALQVTVNATAQIRSVSRSEFFSLLAGDYIELMYAADDTNITIDSYAATAFAPAAPATLVSVTQIQQ